MKIFFHSAFAILVFLVLASSCTTPTSGKTKNIQIPKNAIFSESIKLMHYQRELQQLKNAAPTYSQNSKEICQDLINLTEGVVSDYSVQFKINCPTCNRPAPIPYCCDQPAVSVNNCEGKICYRYHEPDEISKLLTYPGNAGMAVVDDNRDTIADIDLGRMETLANGLVSYPIIWSKPIPDQYTIIFEQPASKGTKTYHAEITRTTGPRIK